MLHYTAFSESKAQLRESWVRAV